VVEDENVVELYGIMVEVDVLDVFNKVSSEFTLLVFNET
jgi:hypothetical protein